MLTDLFAESEGAFDEFGFAVGFYYKLYAFFHQFVSDRAYAERAHFPGFPFGNICPADIAHLFV